MIEKLNEIIRKLEPQSNRFDIFEYEDFTNMKSKEDFLTKKEELDHRYGKMTRFSLLNLMFGDDFIFSVPYYQRPYVWTEMQFKLFLELVFEKAEESRMVRSGEKTELNPSFFGYLIFKYNVRKEAFDIIDGQQRLTTTMLLLMSIRDYFWNCWLTTNDEGMKETSIFFQNRLLIGNKKSQKFRMTHANELVGGYFEEMIKWSEHIYSENKSKLLHQKDDKANRIFESNTLFENYNIAYREIEDYFGIDLKHFTKKKLKLNIDDIEEKLEDLLSSLNNITPYVEIAGEIDTEQQLFESINATSVKLSNIDLAKNYLFMGFQKKEQEDIYNNFWSIFERCFKSSSPAMEKCFYYYVLDKTGEDHPIEKQNKLYYQFKKFVDKELNHFSTEAQKKTYLRTILKELRDFGSIFADTFISKPTDKIYIKNDREIIEISDSMTFLKIVDVKAEMVDKKAEIIIYGNKNIMPLLIRWIVSYSKSLITKEQLSALIKITEVYWFRRMLANESGSNIQRYASTIFGKIEKLRDDKGNKVGIGISNIVEQVYQMLFVDNLDTKAYTPSYHSDEFGETTIGINHVLEISNKDFYTKKKPGLIQFLLYWNHIDYINSSKLMDLFELKSSGYSVEHFIPQSFSVWLEEIRTQQYPWIDVEDFKKSHESNYTSHIHRIGNLFLVPQTFNTELSDSPLTEKIRVMNKNKDQLKIDAVYSDIFDINEWGIEKIVERSKSIVTTILHNYLPDKLAKIVEISKKFDSKNLK